MSRTPYEPYLEHHGILGMKWGVRRYQNSDGSLTPAGRKRRNKTSDSSSEKPKKTKPEKTSSSMKAEKKEEKLKKKIQKGKLSPAPYLSDEELDAAIRRMQKISQYNQLTAQLRPKSKGQRFVNASKDVLASSAKQVGTWAATSIGKYAVQQIVGKAYNYDIFGDPKKQTKKSN